MADFALKSAITAPSCQIQEVAYTAADGMDSAAAIRPSSGTSGPLYRHRFPIDLQRHNPTPRAIARQTLEGFWRRKFTPNLRPAALV